MSDTIRLTLDLSPRLNSIVEKLAEERGATKAEVLRTAIQLLFAASEAAESGMQVGAWTRRDGIWMEREFVGFRP